MKQSARVCAGCRFGDLFHSSQGLRFEVALTVHIAALVIALPSQGRGLVGSVIPPNIAAVAVAVAQCRNNSGFLTTLRFAAKLKRHLMKQSARVCAGCRFDNRFRSIQGFLCRVVTAIITTIPGQGRRLISRFIIPMEIVVIVAVAGSGSRYLVRFAGEGLAITRGHRCRVNVRARGEAAGRYTRALFGNGCILRLIHIITAALDSCFCRSSAVSVIRPCKTNTVVVAQLRALYISDICFPTAVVTRCDFRSILGAGGSGVIDIVGEFVIHLRVWNRYITCIDMPKSFTLFCNPCSRIAKHFITGAGCIRCTRRTNVLSVICGFLLVTASDTVNAFENHIRSGLTSFSVYYIKTRLHLGIYVIMLQCLYRYLIRQRLCSHLAGLQLFGRLCRKAERSQICGQNRQCHARCEKLLDFSSHHLFLPERGPFRWKRPVYLPPGPIPRSSLTG